jgi:hypothetical protein
MFWFLSSDDFIAQTVLETLAGVEIKLIVLKHLAQFLPRNLGMLGVYIQNLVEMLDIVLGFALQLLKRRERGSDASQMQKMVRIP